MNKKRGIIPRKIKGFRDISPAQNALRWHIITSAASVYRQFGFEQWDTPLMEYAECIGKFMPGEGLADGTVSDGIYSFKNPEDEPVYYEDFSLAKDGDRTIMDQFPVALRYDLTAPLARVYAEQLWADKLKNNLKEGKTPLLRRFQFGPVFRFEAKLDPGRFREFWQLDFDTVGATDMAADTEVPVILYTALRAIGLAEGSFVVKVNNRKVLKGFLTNLGITDERSEQDILRIIDKLDKIGLDGVADELGKGRKDSSGAFIKGLALDESIRTGIINFFQHFSIRKNRLEILDALRMNIGDNEVSKAGLEELGQIDHMLTSLGFDDTKVIFDPTLIRGMAYYTGPVFEVESLQTYMDEKGRERRVGAICGGGRYDGLVEQSLGIKVPATGASIGIDRLAELLTLTNQAGAAPAGPVFICAFDAELASEYQQIAHELRTAGIAAEVYYGTQKGLNKQLAYADAKNCPLAILMGSDEKAKGVVSIKNLKLGKEIAATISDKAEFNRKVQSEAPRAQIVHAIQQLLS
ncbi:MAG: histidine--tRNA ligase [Chitinophagales bacterium]